MLTLNIAVSGATGFIGRHVLDELEQQGLTATLLMRPSSRPLPQAGRHRVVRIDPAIPGEQAYELCGRPEALIHLAWGGLPNYWSLHHFENELPMQYRFIKQLVMSGLPNLVVAGTCLEYGLMSGPLNEDLDVRPVVPYAYSKDGLRRQLGFLKREKQFALTWARLFYMHGEGQSATSLLPQLRSAVTRAEKRFPMSGGEQLRDFLPVADVARYLVGLAGKQRDHGVVNVCSGKPISVRSLVEGWIEQHGWSIQPEFGVYPYPDYEPMAFWGDRRKLDRCLGSA